MDDPQNVRYLAALHQDAATSAVTGALLEREELLAQLFAQLLVASRNLVKQNIQETLTIDGFKHLRCDECLFEDSGGILGHTASCRVGRVSELIDLIVVLVGARKQFNSIRKGEAQREEPARAEARTPSGGQETHHGKFGGVER
jgi:hypothetical protein